MSAPNDNEDLLNPTDDKGVILSTSNKGEDDTRAVSPEELERRHFQHVSNTFASYQKHSQKQIVKKITSLQQLSRRHQLMVPNLVQRLQSMPDAVEANQIFLNKILNFTRGMFINSDVQGSNKDPRPITGEDYDRVRTTLKQCVRDWSKEGEKERIDTYEVILNELKNLYPENKFNYEEISILVPGAGLGRLMFEIARLGFTCQGNEFSLYMLFTSNYILNMCTESFSEIIFPWVHETSNVVSNNDQLREIKIPDVNPRIIAMNSNFSMAAGDFLEVYTEPNTWDCITMCFFIDTAHNIIEYIENAYNILKPGGYLINLGPLLYHFSDLKNEQSIELTYEELKFVMLENFNFRMVKEEMNVKCTYINNIQSMYTTMYDCVFFVLQKGS